MAFSIGGLGYAAPSRGGSTVATGSGGTQSGSGPYGGVPLAPSLAGAQESALGADQSQMEKIQSIMDQINRQSAQSAMLPMTLNLPNYQGAMGQAMGNVQDYLAGQVPADVISLMQQQAAERGVATGLPGANISNAAYLRALGLTSLGLQQQGQQNLTNLMGAVPRGTLMDPSGLLVTPGQQYESQWLANQLAAAPNPAEAAAAEMAAVQAGMGSGKRSGGGGGGAYITGGAAPSAPFQPSVHDTNVYRGYGPLADWSRYDPTTAYDRWAGTQPVMMGNVTRQADLPGVNYEDLYADQPGFNDPGISDWEAIYGIPESEAADWGFE